MLNNLACGEVRWCFPKSRRQYILAFSNLGCAYKVQKCSSASLKCGTSLRFMATKFGCCEYKLSVYMCCTRNSWSRMRCSSVINFVRRRVLDGFDGSEGINIWLLGILNVRLYVQNNSFANLVCEAHSHPHQRHNCSRGGSLTELMAVLRH